MQESNKWKNWVAIRDSRICEQCKNRHGKIYALSEVVKPPPPLHMYCRCKIKRLNSIFAGEATNKGIDGADWHLKYNGKLPSNYISKSFAYSKGWKNNGRNLSYILPGKSIGGDMFHNTEGKLPHENGRVWYEADINYTSGNRGEKRILYSNDGLIFVTYNHYETFIEVR